MITKSHLNSLLAGLGLFAVTAVSQAATISCTGEGYDISTKVSGASDCLILSPLDGAVNDSVDPPVSSYTVNTENFFGINTWAFDGKYDITSGINYSNFFHFSGSGQSGTYNFVGSDPSLEFMFVLKDGDGTNLVAYLLPTPAGSGSYSTPFTSPPFSFNGSANNKDISHVSVYYLSEPGGPSNGIPEPGTIAILGLGLLGMGLISRHRKNGQH